MLFVGHGHFSRAVMTRWVELPLYEGIRFAMAAASIAVCGFEHGVRQTQRARADRSPPPVPSGVTREPSFVLAGRGGAVVADGVHTAYPRLADARAALRVGQYPNHLGRVAL